MLTYSKLMFQLPVFVTSVQHFSGNGKGCAQGRVHPIVKALSVQQHGLIFISGVPVTMHAATRVKKFDAGDVIELWMWETDLIQYYNLLLIGRSPQVVNSPIAPLWR